jgi:2-oxoglutarate ferredoxin oxidoreductase subunit alpha
MSDKVLMKGNEAIAEAAIMADCRLFFGYPITPQTEISAYMAKKLPKLNGTFLQAESEIAAINMVIGASSAGKRVMTTSSSPGIALKSEGLSYLAGCDLPAVIANVQRGGPGLGGIQPSQSDYFHATRSAGHGDFRMLVVAPSGVQELLDATYDAFDLADKYRMTVMVLTDGILGQMMEPVDISPKEAKPCVVKDWAVTGTRGEREKNIINSLYLKPEDLEKENFKRHERYKLIEETEARHEEYLTDDVEVVIAAYGACARIARNAVDDLRREGIKAGLIRPVTLWPFPKRAFFELAKKVKGFVVAEMSMGQMIEDVELAIRCTRPVSLCKHAGGVVPQPDEISAKVKELLSNIEEGN